MVPASIGMTIATKSPPTAKLVEKAGSGLGVVFLIIACITGVADNTDLMDASKYTRLWIIALLFEPIGAAVGFALATVFGMDDASRVAIALETGVQNYALVMALVALSFAGCARTKTLAFVLLGTAFYVLNSFWLCGLFRWWRSKGSVGQGGDGGEEVVRP